MADADAEKASEPKGADRWVDAFQRAAKHLGTHVDAKGGLQRGAPCARLWRSCRQCVGEPALGGAFGRLLQNLVDDIVDCRLDWFLMDLGHARPFLTNGRLVL